MAEKEKSERRKVADIIAEKVNSSLHISVKVYITSTNKLKHYYVPFNVPPFTKGQFNIYAPNFIQIDYQYGQRKDNPVFESEKEALKFFDLAIVKGLWDKAYKVPSRPRVEEKKS